MRLKSLRTAFTRALNKKPKSGSAGDINLYTDREKRLLELMKFIIPHIRPSKTISSLPVSCAMLFLFYVISVSHVSVTI